MLTVPTKELLSQIKSGRFDQSDIDFLDRSPAKNIQSELSSIFRVRFQERRIKNKWEIGAARSLGYELAPQVFKDSGIPMMFVVPVFQKCLFLSGEGDKVTGVGRVSRLRAKPIWEPCIGIALTTGRGFKLDKTIDGWHMKPLQKCTVNLSEELLVQRGWRFDAFWKLVGKK